LLSSFLSASLLVSFPSPGQDTTQRLSCSVRAVSVLRQRSLAWDAAWKAFRTTRGRRKTLKRRAHWYDHVVPCGVGVTPRYTARPHWYDHVVPCGVGVTGKQWYTVYTGDLLCTQVPKLAWPSSSGPGFCRHLFSYPSPSPGQDATQVLAAWLARVRAVNVLKLAEGVGAYDWHPIDEAGVNTVLP